MPHRIAGDGLRGRAPRGTGLETLPFVDPHEEAFATVTRWWRAWVEKDLETVRALVDPAYAERSETRHLRPKPVDDLLREASRYASEVAITRWEVFDLVTRLSEDIITCDYRFHLEGRRRGRAFIFAGRATDVLAKRAGKWAYVSHYGVLETDRALP